MADLKSKQIKFPLTGTSVVSSSAQIATDISGSFVADSGSFSTRVTTAETELGNTLVSSSAQIADDISGSLSTAAVVGLGASIVSASAQLSTDISGSFVAPSASFSTRVTTAESELGNTLLSGSAQIADDISGSLSAAAIVGLGANLVSASAQVDHDSTTNFVANEHIDHTSVSITAGAGLTGGGTIASTRDIAVGAGTGVTVNANDVAIGQAVGTTSNVKFNHITGSGNISGSVAGNILGYKSGSFTYLETSADISSSGTGSFGNLSVGGGGGITIDEITTSGTASLASIKLSGESSHISGSLGVITGFAQANITSASLDYADIEGDVTASKLYGTIGTATQATIDHDSLANFVSDEHVAHGDVSIVAGTGLTGGGTIAANRTLNVVGGTGVTANANDIAIGQDVATTANVLFNHISASGNVSSSGTGSFERLEVGGGGGISLETVTASDTGSFASIKLSGESGHISGSLGLITGFKNIEGTSGSFSYVETTGNISSSASGSFLNIYADDNINATNLYGTVLTATQATIDHDSLANFVANEHIDHTSVTMTAGAGLTGGGTIAATRTLAVGAGTGVTVNANDVAIGQAVATDSDVEFATITTTGNITAQGDIIAENYIVSSSVTHLTSSAISGSSIFGDTQDDTHQFTGSVFVSGSTFNVTSNGSVSSSNSGSFLNVKAANNVNATNLYGTVLTATQATIDHDSLANFVADEHVVHGDVSVIAGTGLTGGGTIAANRTLNVIGGDGITANANDIAITAAQTTITSVLAEDLKIGEDAQTKIDFETSNEIHFDVNNSELLNLVGAKISGSQASTGSFGSLVTDANVGIGEANPSVALEVIGSISGSQSGSFLNVDITDNLGVTGKFTLPNITDVSASIASAVAGGDDMGNHTATQDLDMDGNDIFDIGHISSSGNISGSAGDILGFDSLSIVSSGSFGTNLGVGTTTPAESLEVIGAVSASTSGSFLNIDAPHILATNVHGTILTATQATIDHDSLANFVADEHVAHGDVSVVAGAGLTGGGTIAANRTINVVGGTGVTANANDVAIGQDVATTANVTFNHISASGNISGSAGSFLGFDSGSFNTNLGIGTLTPAESLEVIGAVSASTSGSFLNIESPDIKATRVHGTILTATQATIDHDSLANFVANEHIDHSAVSVVAGAGLTGGGTIAANRTLNVVGGDGITANANDIAITAAQTTITSVLAEDLKLGEDAQTKIDFETANEIHFDVNNIETFNMAGLQLSGSQASTGSFGSVVTDANIGVGVANPKTSIEVIGSVSSSASGSFLNVDITDNLHIANDIKLIDNGNVLFGADNDMNITHNGTDSFIDNYKGHLNLRTQDADKDVILSSDDGSGGLTAYLTLDGSTKTLEAAVPTNFAATSSHASIKLNHAGHLSGSLGTITGIKQANITSGSLDYINVTGLMTASGLETSGDVIAFGSSDRGLKDDIKPIENPLEKMEKIGGYTFVWNGKQSTYKGKDIGVVAQEIQSVLPEIVATRANGYLGVKYEKIVPLLIESIKENTKQIKELKQEINEIKENCDCLNK